MNDKKHFRRIVIAASAVASLSLCACMYGPAPDDDTVYQHYNHIPSITDITENTETDDTPAADILSEATANN